MPPTARTRSWLTLEQNQQLFVWNDPQGNLPPADVTIPRIDGAYSDEWSNWTWDSLTVDANCREVVDNVVDMAHFFYIHYAFPTYFRNVFEGHIAAQYLKTRSRPDYEPDARQAAGPTTEIGLVSEAAYYGPSYMIDYLSYDYHGVPMDAVLINCHYPVTPERFILQWGVIVKKLPGLSPEQADKVAAKFAKFVGLGFQQDVDIWTHKSRIDNPLLCADDGPVYQLRRWYEQFYTDVEQHPGGHGRAARVRGRYHRARSRRGRPRSRPTSQHGRPMPATPEPARHDRCRRLARPDERQSRTARSSATSAGRSCSRPSSACSTPACSGTPPPSGSAPSSPGGPPTASRPR